MQFGRSAPSGTGRAPQERTISVGGVPTAAVVFPYRRLRAGALALIGAAFTAVGTVWLFRLASAIHVDLPFSALLENLPTGAVGLVCVAFFGPAFLLLSGVAFGRCSIALTAEALVVRDLMFRIVVPWRQLETVRTTTERTQQVLLIRLVEDADIRWGARARLVRRLNRWPPYGEHHAWIVTSGVHRGDELPRALRWHKRAPDTETALTEGLDGRWRRHPSERAQDQAGSA